MWFALFYMQGYKSVSYYIWKENLFQGALLARGLYHVQEGFSVSRGAPQSGVSYFYVWLIWVCHNFS